jgi:hypothetical protein
MENQNYVTREEYDMVLDQLMTTNSRIAELLRFNDELVRTMTAHAGALSTLLKQQAEEAANEA